MASEGPAMTTQQPPITTKEVAEPTETYTSDHSSIGDTVAEKQASDDNGPRMEDLTRVETEFEYPPAAQGTVVMLALLLTIFLVALDRTIIATAIPQITNDFNSLSDIGWYGSAFLLTSCCFQLLIGRIYTYYTPKYIFLGVVFVFEIGSAVCGAAPNSVAFIVGRAIAGLGAGGIMSGAVVLMTSNVPLAKRPMWQGFFGAVFGIASVAGPLLGGAFTSNVTWRWCFYINLPIGGAVLLVLLFILKPVAATKKGVPIKQQLLNLDPIGSFFLLPSIVCLLLALQWGGAQYAWSDGRIIALLVVFAVTFLAFIAVQVFMNETATVPASIIKNRSVLAGIWWTFCIAGGMMIMVYYVPIWFQAIKGVTAVQSGINLLPIMLSLVVGTITAGALTGRLGYYTPFAYASAILMPIGAGLVSTWTPDTGSGMWIGYQVLYGFGLGLGMQQGNLAAQTVLARRDVPTGISLMFFAQMLSGAIFISVGQNILDQNLVSGLVGQLPGVDAARIINTGATDLRSLADESYMPVILGAYNNALRQVFYVAVGMAAIAAPGAFLLEWKSVKTAKDGKTKTAASKEATKEAPEEQV